MYGDSCAGIFLGGYDLEPVSDIQRGGKLACTLFSHANYESDNGLASHVGI